MLLVSKKFVLFKKPMTPSRFQAYPAVPELGHGFFFFSGNGSVLAHALTGTNSSTTLTVFCLRNQGNFK